MARFRNAVSGVLIDVDEMTVARMPGTWEPADEPKTAKKTTTRKSTSSQKKSAPSSSSKSEPDETDDE